MSTTILFDTLESSAGLVGLITLNRPEALNALNLEMMVSLNQQLEHWEYHRDIKAVIIKATQGRAFCAGGDLKAVYEERERALSFFEAEYRLNRRLFHYPKPYLALLDGITMGGGAGLSLPASYRISTNKLLFAMPETAIGFFPDVGSSYFLSRLPGQLGLYLALSSARLEVDDCLALGLVNYQLSASELDGLVLKIMDLDDINRASLERLFQSAAEHPCFSPLLEKAALIDEHFSKPNIASLILSLEQSADPWCQKLSGELQQKSPTSLTITFELLKRAKHLNFDECMDLDDCLVRHFLQDADFYEGIRAFIIDKDQKPQWKPADLSSLPSNLCEQYFTHPVSRVF